MIGLQKGEKILYDASYPETGSQTSAHYVKQIIFW